MNIYKALQKDHRQFESLLVRIIESSKSGTDEWKSLLEELRSTLIPHAHAEEAVFYNALREVDESKALIAHSYVEHLKAETELRTLLASKVMSVNFTTLMEKLRDDLHHHIEEEEGKIFEAARKVFSEEEANKIGEAFEQLKPEYAKSADSMVVSTVDLIANILPTRFVESFKSTIGKGRQDAA